MRTNSYVIGCTIIAALGGLLFGFDTAVISGTTTALERVYELSPFWKGFTVAAALIGTIIGSLAIGKPADAFGRRTVMFWLAVLYFVSAVGSALAWDWTSFVVFRFIGGLGVGGASVVSPMYTAEIAPARMRGRLVAVTQFNIVLGILLAFASNYAIAGLALGATEWRWMFGVEAFPAAAFFLLLFLVPESPRWLVAVGRDASAATVLDRLGSDTGDTASELAEIRRSLETEQDALAEPFFRMKYIRPILLAFAISAFNQLSGINAILYYAPEIFARAGFEESAALLSSVGVGFMNLVFTMAALAVIDRFGRRFLMLFGSVGYIVSLSAAAWAFYTYGTAFTGAGSAVVLISLLVFIASHAFGQGAVIWVFISEIFPNRVRARGQAFGTLTHWVFAAAISWTFPLIAERSGGHIFAFYAVCMIGQLAWVLLVMPETKGVPLEHIQQKLGIQSGA